MSYVVGIDLGTTSTVAAVCRPDGSARVVPLEGAAGAVPSAVYLGADGAFLVGEAALRRALSDPGHVVRDLTRRIGDATPVLVGRRPVSPDELAARFLARLVDDAARREGGVAARVAVTHPASFGPHRMGALHAALAEQGLGSAMLVPEPVAAATGYAAGAMVEPGAAVAVYDLGGGRCDATVLRRERDGFAIVGAPEGVENFGGADLDEVVLGHVRDALGPAWEELDPTDPDVLAAVADLRRAATSAKEALSHDTEVLVPVVLPGTRTQVRLGRAEFEEMIRPALTETAEAMRRALDSTGTSAADLAALVLVGGSSRIPLVPQLLSEEFGRDVTVASDPTGVVAVGAALVAAGPARPATADGRPARPTSGAGVPAGAVAADGPSARPTSGAGAPAAAVAGAVAAGAAVGAVPPSPPGQRTPPSGEPAAQHLPGVPDRAMHGSPASGPAGPGSRPLAVGGGPASRDGTEVLAVARPPKQARPFMATPPSGTSRPRRIALLASAGALSLAVLGGAVAFGIERIGAGTEADAVTPVGSSVTQSSAPLPAEPAVVVPVETPVQQAPPPPQPPQPPPRRATRAAATTTSAPPPVTTTTPTPPEVTEEPTETSPPEETAPPESGDGTGEGGANDGASDNGGTGGAAGAEQGAAEANAAPAGEGAPAG